MIQKISNTIANKQCFIYDCGSLDTLLIQPIGAHDLKFMDSEVALIEELAGGKGFTMAMFLVDWNRDLPPWEAEPVFGDEAFGSGARETLRFITEHLIPELIPEAGSKAVPEAGPKAAPESVPEAFSEKTEEALHESQAVRAPEIILGGYSLAGLFALWAAYQTDIFKGVAAASPSVWYPGWPAFAEANELRTGDVYLSLGTKEEKVRNPVMKTVGDNIRKLYEDLKEDPACSRVTLEMNPGNHFREPDLRMAKGFAWAMK